MKAISVMGVLVILLTLVSCISNNLGDTESVDNESLFESVVDTASDEIDTSRDVMVEDSNKGIDDGEKSSENDIMETGGIVTMETVPDTNEVTVPYIDTDVDTDTITPNNYKDKNCKLFVNGKDITNLAYVYLNKTGQYAELPLIAIWETLGADIAWDNATEATIIYNKIKYKLYISENRLIEEGSNKNYIAFPPGTTHNSCYYTIDGYYIVDSTTMSWLLKKIAGLEIVLDYNNNVINIQ